MLADEMRPAPRSLPAGTLFLVLAVLLAPACTGEDFEFETDPPAGSPSPVAAIYDIECLYPDMDFPEFAATGLRLELTMEIDPRSVEDPDSPLEGSITVQAAKVAGVARSFDPNGPIEFTGELTGNEIRILFGPVKVGSSRLRPDLIGIVSSDARRLDGEAAFRNLSEEGSWIGIKQRRYLVAGSAFGLQGTASIVTVRFDTRFSVTPDVELISGDPVAASSRQIPLIINRFFFDNIQVLDPESEFLTALQFSTGNGSNPHDALMADDERLYVTRYEPGFNDILIADPETGRSLGRIPLKRFATNSSGTARPDRMVAVNGMVLVTLQNVDATFQEYGPGIALFIDPMDDSVVSSITLDGQNPFGSPSVHPTTGEVYIAAAGIFQGLLPRELSGGIEVIDPISLTSRGILIDDDDLGGNVSGIAVTSSRRGYAVVVTTGGSNALVAFHPRRAKVLGTVLSTSAFIPEIRYDGDGYLIVAEHDFGSPALRILDAATGSDVERIPLSLPPVSVAILTRGLLGGS
jgi:DNA-binding beta-propeller fold protein YncE